MPFGVYDGLVHMNPVCGVQPFGRLDEDWPNIPSANNIPAIMAMTSMAHP